MINCAKTDFLSATVLGLTLSVASGGIAKAATVNILTDAQQQYVTQNGIRSNTSTDDEDLAGMLVTANYSDGSSETLTWNLTGTYSGLAAGNWMELSYPTWQGFHLTTTNTLSSVRLNAGVAGSIFDITFGTDGDVGNTPTTYGGEPFSIVEAGSDLLEGVIDVTYSGLVTLAGAAPGVDAYTEMLVDFSGLSTGGLLGHISFLLDLDTLADAGDLTPVPLPAGLALLLGALGMLGMVKREKRIGTAPA